MTIIADSAYLKGDLTKLAKNTYNKRDPEFSGYVLYFTPKGKYVSGWQYKNGQLVVPGNSNKGINVQKSKTSNSKYKPLLKQIEVCEDWYWVTEDDNGEITSVTYLYTVCHYEYEADDDGGGGSTDSPPPPPICPDANPDPGNDPGPGHDPVQVSTYKGLGVAPWSPPPSDGGGGGDGGGFPPPQPNQPCQEEPKIDTSKIDKDPCKEKKRIQTKLQEAVFVEQTKKLREKISLYANKEWGGEQVLNTWPKGTFKLTDIREGINQTQFGNRFSWDKDHGFTIGFIHDHPDVQPPSPSDVFSMLTPLDSAPFMSAGSSAMDYYKANFTMTVVNADVTYVVTINNFNELQRLNTIYQADITGFNQRYQNAIRSLQDYDSGFLSIFGSSINVYKANKNDNIFTPIKLDTVNKQVVDPCPEM
jgi:hypothetical protein